MTNNSTPQTRKDQLLDAMGITQWVLRRPEALLGNRQITLLASTFLVIVSDELISPHDKLLKDILISLQKPMETCLLINFTQIHHIKAQSKTQPIYWLLSDDDKLINTALPLCQSQKVIWQSLGWTSFKKSTIQKRQLWQNIQQVLSPIIQI